VGDDDRKLGAELPNDDRTSHFSREGGLIDGGNREQTESMTVQVQVQRFASGYNVVRVNGDLSGNEGSTLHQFVAEELTRTPAHLALDLSGVKRIDRAGIEALSAAAGLAANSNTSFCLVAAEAGPVATALVAAHKRQWFEIFASVQDAWDHPR
jgi:anti-anti-sigma factor